jgi:hypothetical protein
MMQVIKIMILPAFIKLIPCARHCTRYFPMNYFIYISWQLMRQILSTFYWNLVPLNNVFINKQMRNPGLKTLGMWLLTTVLCWKELFLEMKDTLTSQEREFQTKCWITSVLQSWAIHIGLDEITGVLTEDTWSETHRWLCA